MMKYLLVFPFFISSFIFLGAQSLTNHNPSVKQGDIFLIGESEVALGFIFEQELSTYVNAATGRKLSMSICLENITADLSKMSEISENFTWSFNKEINCFYAEQNADLVKDEELKVSVKGVLASSVACEDCDGLVGFNVNIQPVPSMNGINDRGDDNLGVFVKKSDLQKATPDTGSEIALTVYPNPTTDLITLQLDQPVIMGEVSIVDSNGRSIFTREYASISQESIATDHLASGLYTLRVISEDSDVELTKMFSVIR